MQNLDPKVTNTTALAYMGDAVYEVYIRNFVIAHGPTRVDAMNRKKIRYVGFEALVGYLYLDGQTERLQEVVTEAMRIIEEN